MISRTFHTASQSTLLIDKSSLTIYIYSSTPSSYSRTSKIDYTESTQFRLTGRCLMQNLLILTTLFSLSLGCDSLSKKPQNQNSIVSAIKLLEEKERTKFDISTVSFRDSDSIFIPADAELPKIRALVNAYLNINKMQIIQRGDQSIVANLSEFDKLWHTDIKEAEELSARENKPMLIKFTTTYCGACEEQDKMFFQQEKVFRLLQNFVLLKIHDDEIVADLINSKETAYTLLAKKYDVAKGLGFPTIVLASKSGNETLRGHAEKWDEYWSLFFNFQKAHSVQTL
ncbi:MAG: thioredoxin family protein [Proteobacteria bacterium]|nr:MAG: thioredoxin family protein [Pseudomonadota bacterium]